MARGGGKHAAAVLLLVLLHVSSSDASLTSQGVILLQMQRLLSYPQVLGSWSNATDFCDLQPSSSMAVVCFKQRITQLHVAGTRERMLPRDFSIDALFTTLAYLPRLKALTLYSLGLWGEFHGKLPDEFSALRNLRVLVLDDNLFGGEIPSWIGALSSLSELSLRKNLFNGSLPKSISGMENLRVLALSDNLLRGEVPDLDRLINLEVLDLEGNGFGPSFPVLGNSLFVLKLANNKFRDSLAEGLGGNLMLRWFDASNNSFVGPFPMAVLSLPVVFSFSMWIFLGIPSPEICRNVWFMATRRVLLSRGIA